MHKLLEYVCDELEELEKKADKNGKLSMQEMQYVDMLAHTKKNLMKAEEMSDEGEMSHGRVMGYSYARGSGRNAKRDSMGRYSRAYEDNGMRGSYNDGYTREDPKEELAMSLKELKMEAKDQETEQMINRWIKQLEQM